MPFMTLETCKADLARTVSALPNLHYVDLPEGLFTEDSSSTALGQELRHRCPALRKMKYSAGSESSFSLLATTTTWLSLEVLELDSLVVEPSILLYVFASFPGLQELKFRNMESVDDAVLTPNPGMPTFPVLRTLSIEGPAGVTLTGLLSYLARSECQKHLAHLSLRETKITPQDLQSILSEAQHLSDLDFRASVSASFPMSPVSPLRSASLRTLHFEILPASKSLSQVTSGYHQYLAASLLLGSLPHLTTLFAFCPSLPELLLMPPKGSMAPDTFNHLLSSRFSAISFDSSSNSSTHSDRLHPNHTHLPQDSLVGMLSPINLYTKPATAPELEWSLTTLDPPSDDNGRQGSMSATRPLSMISNSAATTLLNASRKGSAFGGFLAIPVENSSHGKNSSLDRKGSKNSIGDWMGSE